MRILRTDEYQLEEVNDGFILGSLYTRWRRLQRQRDVRILSLAKRRRQLWYECDYLVKISKARDSYRKYYDKRIEDLDDEINAYLDYEDQLLSRRAYRWHSRKRQYTVPPSDITIAGKVKKRLM